MLIPRSQRREGNRVAPFGLCVAPFLIALVLSAIVAFGFVQSLHDGRYYEQEARKAFQAGNYPSFLESTIAAEKFRPNHPRLLYMMAIGYQLTNRSDDAISTLKRIADMGLFYPAITDPTFKSLAGLKAFNSVTDQFESNKSPHVHSTEAFRIPLSGEIPEGLAYDPGSNSFLIGAVHDRAILRVKSDNSVSVVAGEDQGLWGVFGLKVDPKNRVIWACTAALPQIKDFQAADNGKSAIVKVDLNSGKVLKRYPVPAGREPSVLGDLTLNKAGDVFTTDSLSPAIYKLAAVGDKLELWRDGAGFSSPQGLAFSDDERWLYMADYAYGVFRIDVTTKEARLIQPDGNVTMLGIDGLYMYKGRLVGVQNGVNPNRIVRISPDSNESNKAGFEVLESGNPVFDDVTLGVLKGDSIFFIANSQWGAFGDDGKIDSSHKFIDTTVLRLKL